MSKNAPASNTGTIKAHPIAQWMCINSRYQVTREDGVCCHDLHRFWTWKTAEGLDVMSHLVCLASWSLTTTMTNMRGTGGTEDHGIGGLCVRNAPQDRFLGIPRRDLRNPSSWTSGASGISGVLVDSSKCSEVLYSKKRLALQQQDRACECFIWQFQCSTTMSAAVAPYPSEPRPPVRGASGSTKSLGERCPPGRWRPMGRNYGGQEATLNQKQRSKINFLSTFQWQVIKMTSEMYQFPSFNPGSGAQITNGILMESHALPTLEPCLLCAVEVVRHWDEPIPLIFSSLHGAMICQGACTSQKVCPVACASHCPCCQCCSKEKFTSCSLWGL